MMFDGAISEQTLKAMDEAVREAESVLMSESPTEEDRKAAIAKVMEAHRKIQEEMIYHLGRERRRMRKKGRK